MRLWADLYNAEGVRQGAGPVWSLKDATINRSLDGAGSVTVSAPGTEERANDLLKNERRIKIAALQPGAVEGKPQIRHLGSGILRDVEFTGSSSNWSISANGPDMLDELKRRNTLLARIYSGETIGQVCNHLAGLAGWTAIVDPDEASKLFQTRFDGVSVLKALQQIGELNGLHLREGAVERTIEVGRFGQDSGVCLVNAAYALPQIASNNNVMLIENIKIKRTSEQMVNWLVPLGNGEGELAITLEHCTQTQPEYPISTISVGGKIQYYICDPASIALYGQIEKVGTFKDIGAISNSDVDLEAAANALYIAAVEWLKRNKDRIDTYRVSVKKARRTIRAGDKVHLTYKGIITNEKGNVINYADVDGDFWVMRANERIGLEGISLDLDITSIDQMIMDAAQIIVGAIDTIQMNNLRVQPYPNTTPFVYRREMDATHTAVVPIEITNAMLYLNQCRITLFTRPYRLLAKAVASGSLLTGGSGVLTTSADGGGDTSTVADHAHPWSEGPTDAGPPAAAFTTRYIPLWSNSVMKAELAGSVTGEIPTGLAGSHKHVMPDHEHEVPNHHHTMPDFLVDFGIIDDDQYPDTIRCAVDGVDATEALGGPWGVGGVVAETSLDITAYLVNASGGLRQRHEVTFSCDGGQGEIEVTVELRTTVQSIAVV